MNKKTTAYLDTSVISALHDRRNPERQYLTRLFFAHADYFDVFVSELVLAEIGETGDSRLRAKLRKTAIRFRALLINEECGRLASAYAKQGVVPHDYPEDAMHLAIASVARIDYILSWNFKHLVNIRTRKLIHAINAPLRYPRIEIVTPAEILPMEGDDDEER